MRGRSGERGASEYGGGGSGDRGGSEYAGGKSGGMRRLTDAEKKLEQWKEKNLGAGGGSREERGGSQGGRAPAQERRRSGEGGRSRPPQRTPSPSDFNHIQPIQSWERGSSQGEGRGSRGTSLQGEGRGSRDTSLQGEGRAGSNYNTSRTDEAIARLTGFGQVRGRNLATSLLQISLIQASDLSQSRNLSFTVLSYTGLSPLTIFHTICCSYLLYRPLTCRNLATSLLQLSLIQAYGLSQSRSLFITALSYTGL